MTEKNYHGKCLCGSVEINTTQVPHEFGACHCSMCRKWSSGPYLSMNCGQDVRFKGEEHIGKYKSSEWAERHFCKNCGTHLCYFFLPQKLYMVSLSLFDNLEDMAFTFQGYIDKKPAYYDFKNDTKCMTEAEVLQLYGG